MRDLLILGTDAHSRDAATFGDRANRAAPRWNLQGFLTLRREEIGSVIEGLPVLGDADALGRFRGAALLPGFGWPKVSPEVEERFITLIDPSSVVCRTARVGRGCLVYPHVFVGAGAVIGDRCLILSGCVINHDAILADRVILTAGVKLAGYVHVETGCELGQGCTVRQRIRIGAGSLVGMGAVVIRDVEPNSVVVGNPARFLRANLPAGAAT
jgi:sugar O-acyltransferase (sialic acid O-acetyltransferase NeuD family)